MTTSPARSTGQGSFAVGRGERPDGRGPYLRSAALTASTALRMRLSETG